MLENDQEALKKSYGLYPRCSFEFKWDFSTSEMKLTEIHGDQTTNNNDVVLERDSLRQEIELFKLAIDQWSKQFEGLRLINEELTR